MDAQGLGTLLLADIAAIFAAQDPDKLPSLPEALATIHGGQANDKLASATLCESLAAIEGRPWSEWGRQHKPISPNQLAKLLRPFGVAPHGIRVGGETPRGYEVADFDEAFFAIFAGLPASRLQHRNNAR